MSDAGAGRDSSETSGYRTKDNKPFPSLLSPRTRLWYWDDVYQEGREPFPCYPQGITRLSLCMPHQVLRVQATGRGWKCVRIPSYLVSASSQIRKIWAQSHVMDHILRAGFLYLFIPETGHPIVHIVSCLLEGILVIKEGGRVPPHSALAICSPRTKLISDTQGALRAGEWEEEGVCLKCDKSRAEWQKPSWHSHEGLAANAHTPPGPHGGL